MNNMTWEQATLSDVCNNGANYMYSLLCDYERYIKNYGFVTINDFLPKWTCITYKSFENLRIGDKVYDPNGTEYIIMEEPWESDDETYLGVEVTTVKKDGTFDKTGTSNEILHTGDLYAEPVTHRDYLWKIRKIESEEALCPILITKTNQPQS